MLRFISIPLSSAHRTRSIATQTEPAPPTPATRTRQTQTEPRLCLSCHTAQLVELLRPGRAGRPSTPQDYFYGSFLSPIAEEDEGEDERPVAADPTPSQVLAASLLGPGGFPLAHALHDPDLLQVVMKLAPQSLADRTAE